MASSFCCSSTEISSFCFKHCSHTSSKILRIGLSVSTVFSLRRAMRRPSFCEFSSLKVRGYFCSIRCFYRQLTVTFICSISYWSTIYSSGECRRPLLSVEGTPEGSIMERVSGSGLSSTFILRGFGFKIASRLEFISATLSVGPSSGFNSDWSSKFSRSEVGWF